MYLGVTSFCWLEGARGADNVFQSVSLSHRHESTYMSNNVQRFMHSVPKASTITQGRPCHCTTKTKDHEGQGGLSESDKRRPEEQGTRTRIIEEFALDLKYTKKWVPKALILLVNFNKLVVEYRSFDILMIKKMLALLNILLTVYKKETKTKESFKVWYTDSQRT